jgi:hypothetical protein
MQLISRMLLHANRVGHANRAIDACRDALSLLRRAIKLEADGKNINVISIAVV